VSQFFQVHPEDPQPRLIKQAVEFIHKGGVIIYPTDSCYALGCHIGDKSALERIRRIRQVDAKHNFTLMCRDLTEVGTYAKLDNRSFRLIKNLSPGPFTFILPATSEVPRRLMHPKRKTIGLRLPDNPIASHLLDYLGEPLMTSTLALPGEEWPMIDPYEMKDTLGPQVDLIIDGGYCGMEPTTVIDLTGDEPEIVRQGKGDASSVVM
jgi:tRNA threonylcarbamoyl adenosine modification protein (Sua5/YciO/YrdC/YwlC family)